MIVASSVPTSRLPAANVSSIPLRSPLRYPGGKTWLVPHVREWLRATRPRLLVEPFLGGGTVVLTAIMENLADHAIVVECAPDVAAFWRAALADDDVLKERVATFDPTPETVAEWELAAPADDSERAFRTLVLNRTRRGGILAPGAGRMNRGENGKGIGSRWYPVALVERLRAIGRSADRISFYEGDGARLLGPLLRGQGSRVAAFLDPPYTAAGGRQAGSRLYAKAEIDHEALFETLAGERCSFMATSDEASVIVRLVARYGFHAVRVEPRTTLGETRAELVVTRERLFA